MAQYKYRAKKENEEQLLEGIVEAETESLAVAILEAKGWRVLFLEEKKSSWAQLEIIISGVKPKDLVVFSRQLSILISAAVPLVQALRDVITQTKNIQLKKALIAVANETEGGVKFSEALTHYPNVFNSFFVNIVRSGEMSGRLKEVLLYLAEQLEKDYELKSKIKGALIYPLFVLGSLLAIGVLLMMFVVPKLTEMLARSGTELPLATRIVKGLSDFLVDYWWLVLVMIVILTMVGYFIVRTPEGRRFVHVWQLKLPIFGRLYHYVSIIKFSRSLRTLILGGQDIVSSLELAAAMTGNVVYQELVLEAKKTVEAGGDLAEPFTNNESVPKMLAQMLATGEKTGRVEEVLEKLSQFYTREVNNIVRNLMSLLEPFIMIILGVAVAVMILAIILPMYQLSTTM